jgi:hypothetical protein
MSMTHHLALFDVPDENILERRHVRELSIVYRVRERAADQSKGLEFGESDMKQIPYKSRVPE